MTENEEREVMPNATRAEMQVPRVHDSEGPDAVAGAAHPTNTPTGEPTKQRVNGETLRAMLENKSGMMPLAWLETAADLRDARATVERLTAENANLADSLLKAVFGEREREAKLRAEVERLTRERDEARMAGLEDAARLLDRHSIESFHEGSDSGGAARGHWFDRSKDAERYAAAIRALAVKGAEEPHRGEDKP